MLATLVVFAVVMIAVPSQAQDFTNNTGGTYNATCNAVIKMKTNDGDFNGTAQLGTAKANAIEGTVDWSSATAGQPVQGLYYTNLFLSGGTKTLADGIFVVGGGTDVLGCPAALTGYEDLDTGYPYWSDAGTLTYTGTFTYDGASGTTQNIFADTYNDLALTDEGDKVIDAGDDVTVVSITSDATTPLDILGILNLGTGASDLAGEVTLNDIAAEINVGTGTTDFTTLTITNGTLTAEDGDGTVSADNINLDGTTSVLVFGDNTNLVVSGTLDNDGDGTNLDFTCLSTVTYDGGPGQVVAPTISSNSYGSLVLTGGNKEVGIASNYVDDIYVCDDFSLAGGNFDMTVGADGTSSTAGSIIFLTDPTATVTYAANAEVVGSMNRTTNASALSYTMNNAQTILSLAGDSDNPTSMELYVEGDENPEGYVPASDVQRKVRLDYTGNAGDFLWTARVGYLIGEGPAAGGGTWPGIYSQESIRFYEDGDEKVGTTITPTRLAAAGANLGYVQLAGIGNTGTAATPNGVGVFASGNDLVLRAGPTTFYSVDDGRWTNPNVWDEGTQPTAIDNVEIRHVIYAGIDGPFVGTLDGDGTDGVAANNTLAELTHYGIGVNAANNVTIIDADATYLNPALVLGNEDNGVTYVLNFAGNLTNQNNGTTAAFPFALATKATAATTDFNGLWLINNSLLTDGINSPKLGMDNIINTGTVNNEGIIELGN